MSILYFLTPKTLAKFGIKAAGYIPIIGPTISFNKKTMKIVDGVSNSNPVTVASRGVNLALEYCFGKGVVLPVECALWMGFTIAGTVTVNGILLAAAAEMGNIILDEITD